MASLKSQLPQSSICPDGRALALHRLGPWAGIIGPVLFVGVFMIEGWLRPGYDSKGMFVSALSLGPRGWIQIVNFVFVGVSFLIFSGSVAVQFKVGKAHRLAPVLLMIIGFSLLVSGPLVMDPVTTPILPMSWHSRLHYFFGALVFSLGPVSCFVFFRRFRSEPNWRSFQWWTFAAGTIMAASVVLLNVELARAPTPTDAHNNWVGVIQRVAIITYMAWTSTLGLAMLGRSRNVAGP